MPKMKEINDRVAEKENISRQLIGSELAISIQSVNMQRLIYNKIT